MNYRRIYFDMIQNAKAANRSKQSDTYYEKHHIVPRSLGGDNLQTNTVLLTAREHFLAHWLLWKFEDGIHKNKMAYAFFKMCRKSENKSMRRPIMTGYKYEIAKKANAIAMGNLHRGKIVSDETRQKMSNAKKGDKTSGSKNNFFGKEHSQEIKDRIRAMARIRNKGEGNPKAKYWNIEFPSGEMNTIKSLKTFCAGLNVSVRDMRLNKVIGYKFIGEAFCNFSD